MQLAQAVGIDPKTVNYVSYDGGGELLPALLGNKIAFGASGFGEFLDQVEAGDVRVLAVTERRAGRGAQGRADAQGEGHRPEFTNWRGVVAPPGISDEDKQVWIDALHQDARSPQWKDALEKNGWIDAFVTGDEFGTSSRSRTRGWPTPAELGLA